MKTPAERIRKGLDSLGISVAEASRRLCVKHQAVHAILSGKTPGYKHFQFFADLLGTTREWIGNGTGDPPSWARAPVRVSEPVAQYGAAERDAIMCEILRMREDMAKLRAELRAERAQRVRPPDHVPSLAEIDRELTDMERADRG
jgi:transcriptional regulator with XRE-family HTH domain